MRLKTLSRTRVLLRSRECEVGGAAARAASHASVYHGPSTCHQSSTAPAQERAMESLGVPQRPLAGRPDGSRACYVYGIGWSIKKIVSARCLCRSCGVDEESGLGFSPQLWPVELLCEGRGRHGLLRALDVHFLDACWLVAGRGVSLPSQPANRRGIRPRVPVRSRVLRCACVRTRSTRSPRVAVNG